MKLYSYVVARDYGFALNPFHGWCNSRPRANPTSDEPLRSATGSSVPAPRPATTEPAIWFTRCEWIEALPFDAYWRDPRFMSKRPGAQRQSHPSVRRQHLPSK